MPKSIPVKCECKSPAECREQQGSIIGNIMRAARELERIAAMSPMDFLGSAPVQQRITEEEYANHDCHASEEDGCAVCVAYLEQKAAESRAVDTAMSKLHLD